MMRIEYNWICSNRKTLAIQLDENARITVRTPYGTLKKEVEDFLNEKKEWILKHQKAIEERRRERITISGEEKTQAIQEALRVFPLRVEYFAGKMGVTYGNITIREQKTRWGSCSSKGNLNFNWKLVLMPGEVLDYVVVHELAHRMEMNHSKEFWMIVERVMPDYSERKRLLKELGRKYE